MEINLRDLSDPFAQAGLAEFILANSSDKTLVIRQSGDKLIIEPADCFSEEQIIRLLIKKGWSDDEIEEFLNATRL